MPARAGIEVDRFKLEGVVHNSPELENEIREHAREIMRKAQAVYRSRQVASNEWRGSETTPPKYLHSFRVERIQKARAYAWTVRNTDPAAAWVEYGAHAGGRTLVLRYYPLRTAVIAQGILN